MTISASTPAAASDRLDRALALYRDLSEALRGQVDQLKAGGDVGEPEATLKACNRALQAALGIEAGLVKRSTAAAGGMGVELDLDAARDEVLARLAVWAARG